MKKCEVNLKTDDLMTVVDYFDEAGDGRISVSDVGTVLKTAQKKREEILNQRLKP